MHQLSLRGALASAAVLSAAMLPLAPAQSAPAASDEPWFTCPAGHTLETAQGPGQQALVRCVARMSPAPAQCPQGLRATPARDADPCLAPPTRSSSAISDGTSKTMMVGETPPAGPARTTVTMSDGSVRTVTISEASGANSRSGRGGTPIASTPPLATCASPRRIVVDPDGGLEDRCMLVSIVAPASRISANPQ